MGEILDIIGAPILPDVNYVQIHCRRSSFNWQRPRGSKERKKKVCETSWVNSHQITHITVCRIDRGNIHTSLPCQASKLKAG